MSTLFYTLSLISRQGSNALKLALPPALRTEQRVRATNDILMSYYSNDSNLAFVGYSLQFVSELVKLISTTKSTSSAAVLAASLLSKLDPKAVSSFVSHTRSASSLISDVRIFNRLWGMVPLTVWAFDTYHSPPKDCALRYIAYLQVLVNLVYQPMENVAYLAMHKIIGGVSDSAQTKLWLRSCYFWAAHVVLDFFRIFREYQVVKKKAVAEAYAEAREALIKEQEKEGKESLLSGLSATEKVTPSAAVIKKKIRQAIAENKGTWIKGLIINLSYFPLTLHWSLEQGCLSDLTVGFLGAAAAAANIIPKWQAISSLGNK